MAERESLNTASSTKWPPRTRAEGGQVEPVLGGFSPCSDNDCSKFSG